MTTLRARLVRAAAGSFALTVTSTVLVFLSTLLLTRLLGDEGYGVFAFATSLAGMLALPATVGLDAVVIRHLSRYEAMSQWSLANALLRRAHQIPFLVSVVAVLSVGLATTAAVSDQDLTVALSLALASVPLIALSRIRSGVLAGLQHVVLAQVPDSLVRPLFLIGAIVGSQLIASTRLTPTVAVAFATAAYAVAFVVGSILLARRLPQAIRAARPEYHTRAWMRVALPLTFLGGTTLVTQHIATVVLGASRTPEDAGLFSVAARIALLVAFPLAAVNAALGPTVARLWASGDMDRLQRALTRSAQGTLLVSLPITLGVVVLGPWLLSLFGPGFQPAYPALVILTVGQLANAMAGSVGVLHTMSGHERLAAQTVGIAAVINVLLSLVLAPAWGPTGAALAAAATLVGWNMVLAYHARKRLGLSTTAIPGRRSSLRRPASVSDVQKEGRGPTDADL